MAHLSLRSRWFGPSKADVLADQNTALLDVLREERASVTALLSEFVATTKMQAEVLKKQMDLWTAPVGEPIVRIMTTAHEAELERARNEAAKLGKRPGTTTISSDALLNDLGSIFKLDNPSH